MSPEQQRVSIAEACPSVFAVRRFSDGKTQIVWKLDDDTQGPVPTVDPLHDLNVCHKMEKALSEEQFREYQWDLLGVSCRDKTYIACATAAQRAEAFLRTLNLWKEEA